MQHYHMLSGLHGYIPDQNNYHEDKDSAISDLMGFVESCQDSDVTDSEINAISIAPDYTYAEFPIEGMANPIFGVEYAEVVDCDKVDCTEEDDYLVQIDFRKAKAYKAVLHAREAWHKAKRALYVLEQSKDVLYKTYLEAEDTYQLLTKEEN